MSWLWELLGSFCKALGSAHSGTFGLIIRTIPIMLLDNLPLIFEGRHSLFSTITRPDAKAIRNKIPGNIEAISLYNLSRDFCSCLVAE